VAGPVVCHLVAQYEAASVAKDETEHSGHHEQTERTQRLFYKKVDKLTAAMQEMSNLFQEKTGYLLTLDTTRHCLSQYC
jgi:hypothetical protein